MNSIDKRNQPKATKKRQLVFLDHLIINTMLLKWFIPKYLLPRSPLFFKGHFDKIRARVRMQKYILTNHRKRLVLFKWH